MNAFVDKVTIGYLPLQKSEGFWFSTAFGYCDPCILIWWRRAIFMCVRRRYGCTDRRLRHCSNTLLAISHGIKKWIMREVQENGSKTTKSTALQWLGMKVTNHQIRGTIFNSDSTTFDMIVNEIISNVKMASLLSTGLSAILFKKHSALVVLIDDIIRHFNALGL